MSCMNKAILMLSFWLLFFVVSGFGQEARKIDEFDDIYFCDDYLSRMDAVSNELKKNKSTKVYVFVYEGRETFVNKNDKTFLRLPQKGQAKAYFDSIKGLLKYYQADVNQIVFVNSGFRRHRTVEFWAVPLGATPPKPSPKLTRIKYRKGKPKGFCLTCC